MSTRQVLHNADYAGTTFQSFIGWPWDKLFRADFIRERGLRFQALRTTNDAFFTFVALAIAPSIYCTDAMLFHHRTHNATSLEATRRKSWQNALNAVTTIGDYLKTTDNYTLTKRSYENWVSHFILWNVQSLERPPCGSNCAKPVIGWRCWRNASPTATTLSRPRTARFMILTGACAASTIRSRID